MSADLKDSSFSELYEAIAQEAMMAFVTFEKESGHCVFANKLAKELMEVPNDLDISNWSINNLYPDSDNKGHFRLLSDEIINLEGLFQDILVQKKNGHNFIANVGIKIVKMHDRDYLLLMLQDMTLQNRLQREITSKQTAIKSAYEEVLNQNRQLKELDAAKDKFIALTTHELRTPLSAMYGSAEILKLGLYDDEEQLKEFIDMIYSQGQHLLELVNDILDFAKVQAGRMDFAIEKKNLDEFVAEQVEAVEPMATESNIKLEFRPTTADPVCYFDPLRLKQIMHNVLSNAIKYNRKDGQVIVWIVDRGDFLRTYFQDTGEGIAPKDISQVFNEFETLGKVALHHKGTGLGMPITRRLIEGMGGKIDVLSDLGVGSTFWVDIPKNKILNEGLYSTRPANTDDMLAS